MTPRGRSPVSPIMDSTIVLGRSRPPCEDVRAGMRVERASPENPAASTGTDQKGRSIARDRAATAATSLSAGTPSGSGVSDDDAGRARRVGAPRRTAARRHRHCATAGRRSPSPRTAFLALVRAEPAFVEGLLATLVGWVRLANARHADLIGLDVPGRLAKWLLARAERHGRAQTGTAITLGRNQTELAAELGTTRSTLNRAAGVRRPRRRRHCRRPHDAGRARCARGGRDLTADRGLIDRSRPEPVRSSASPRGRDRGRPGTDRRVRRRHSGRRRKPRRRG